MLDLKELEKKLDEALAKETPESLSQWLFTQRYLNELGEGELIVTGIDMDVYKTSSKFGIEIELESELLCPGDNFAMAA